jgi:two-component system cell cycle response regulator DivK
VTGQTILIIDDDLCSRKLARDVLSHVGYAILEAANAEDGLALASSERPGLVLMDVQLPGMSGVEALGRLRADPVTTGIPVIAVTALAMTADRDRLAAAGFDAYLEKPLDVRELPAVVAAAENGSRA